MHRHSGRAAGQHGRRGRLGRHPAGKCRAGGGIDQHRGSRAADEGLEPGRAIDCRADADIGDALRPCRCSRRPPRRWRCRWPTAAAALPDRRPFGVELRSERRRSPAPPAPRQPRCRPASPTCRCRRRPGSRRRRSAAPRRHGSRRRRASASSSCRAARASPRPAGRPPGRRARAGGRPGSSPRPAGRARHRRATPAPPVPPGASRASSSRSRSRRCLRSRLESTRAFSSTGLTGLCR